MNYLFTGFSQDEGVRRFRFESVAADRTRTGFVVGADLSLSRKHGISMQELPLLCCRLLETAGDTAERSLTFTEADMRKYSDARTAAREAAAKSRSHNRGPGPRREQPAAISEAGG